MGLHGPPEYGEIAGLRRDGESEDGPDFSNGLQLSKVVVAVQMHLPALLQLLSELAEMADLRQHRMKLSFSL